MLSYTLCNWNCMPVFCIMFTARLKDTWDQSKLELYCWHSVIITIIVISITVFVIIVIIIVIITAITIVIIFTTIPARSLHDKITLSLHIRLSSYYHMLSSLVGGIPTPLKNMKVNWDDYIFPIYGKIKTCSKPPTRKDIQSTESHWRIFMTEDI